MKNLRLGYLAVLLLLTCSISSQNKVTKKIMEMGREDNRTMQHLDILSNRFGGRPIGSNAYTNATWWLAEQLESWGLEVEVQEAGELPVGFNRGPWFGRMYSDVSMTLDFVTPSYTSGTKGVQRGHVLIEPKNRREFERMKGKLQGAWVLIEGINNGFALDHSESGDSLRQSIIEQNEAARHDTARIVEPALFLKEMKEAGILGTIQASKIPMQAHYDRKNLMDLSFDNLPDLPDIKLHEDQYNIIRKKAERRDYVILEFDIRNHFRPGPVKYHNVIAKITGTKYPDEYVMSGCHLDSYDSATGAVDCGTGVAPNMEMARMLMAAGGDKPDRTILFCFWAGEEFGILGSQYWVAQNKDKLKNISNYFNRDGGPTAASGLVVPENWYDDIVKCTKELVDYDPRIPFKVEKSTRPPTPAPQDAWGTDHAFFARNGVPVIYFQNSDPFGYNFNYREIWHTPHDTYNMSIPEYMEYTSVTQAVTVYNMANLKHIMPRDQIYIQE